MAIQFPPITSTDPAPQDGDQFLDFETGNVWEYDLAQNSWTMIGLFNFGAFQYRGYTQITGTAPGGLNPGDLYSVEDGGIADASYTGIAGETVPQYSLIGVDPALTWSIVTISAQTPWVRVNNTIVPATAGDDLDMETGSYVISSLTDLP